MQVEKKILLSVTEELDMHIYYDGRRCGTQRKT
jgi:hypothetical protein